MLDAESHRGAVCPIFSEQRIGQTIRATGYSSFAFGHRRARVRDELLDAHTGVDLAGVDAALRIHDDLMEVVELVVNRTPASLQRWADCGWLPSTAAIAALARASAFPPPPTPIAPAT